MSSQMDDFDIGKSQSFSLKKWLRLVPYYKPHKKKLLGFFVITILMAAVDILFPVIQRMLIQNNVEQATTDGLWIFVVLYISAAAIQAVFVFFYLKTAMSLDVSACRDLRNALFTKYQQLPISYYNDKSVGYLVAKSISDTDRIATTVAWRTFDTLWSVLYLVGLLITMFIIAPTLALVLAVLIPIGIGISFLFSKKLLIKNRYIRKANSVMAGALNEGITGAKTAKTLVAGDLLTNEFEKHTDDFFKKSVSYSKLNSLYMSLLNVLGSFAVATVIVIGGDLHFSDHLSLADISLFMSYAFSLVWPIIQIANGFTNIVANQANVERFLNVIDQPLELSDSKEVIEKYGDEFNPKKENWEEMIGDIEFKNVSFKYPSSNTYILKDFNLKIPKNTSCALVGETGAGKTTIASLLCRFYEPTEGQILIDGVDYRQRSIGWLAQNIGYVLQTPHLFSGTIKENILYGRQDATEEELQQAAKMVCVDKIVAKQEKGLDTEVGEGGDRFSTGEKQLITFARAIISDPRLFILDEATASIDTQTEHLVQQAIDSILKNRTSLSIAHRLSTIKNSDNILVIEDGKIAEQGNHTQLLKLRGKYFELYKKLSELENSSLNLSRKSQL